MTLVIISILLIAYLLIATERLSNMNKAAVAVFAGTVGWVLYICYGNDYVMSQHPSDYTDFLNGAKPTSIAVKEYIAQNIFLKYVGRAASIVLFRFPEAVDANAQKQTPFVDYRIGDICDFGQPRQPDDDGDDADDDALYHSQ